MKKLRFSIFVFLLILAISGMSSAAESDGIPEATNLLAQVSIDMESTADSIYSDQPVGSGADILDLGWILETAFRNNPRIAAARAEWQASVEMYPQERSFPDPSLSWSVERMTGSGAVNFGVQLMQMIPNPRMLHLMGNRALTMAEMSQVKYEIEVRDVLIDTMASYFELGYIDRAIEIAEINRGLFTDLAGFAYNRYVLNELGAAELSVAESKLAQAEYEYQFLLELRNVRAAKLRNNLNLDSDTPVGTAILPSIESLDLNLDSILAQLELYRQELDMAGLEIETAEINVSLARSLDNPDFTVGLMYNSMGGSTMDEIMTPGDNSWGLVFGVTIPIWDARNRAAVDMAEAELAAASAGYEDMYNMAETMAEEMYWNLQNQARLVELYRNTLLPGAMEAVALSDTWYSEGEISFSQLVESRMVVQNFSLATARAEADYLISLAELQRLIGISLMDFGEVQE